MINPIWSLIISGVALIVSVWSRIESYIYLKEQKEIEQLKRIGEVFLSAQKLKNDLSYNIETLKLTLKNSGSSKYNEMLFDTLSQELNKLEDDYHIIWGNIKIFENIISNYKKNVKPELKPIHIEATIAQYNQRRELARYNIEYLNTLIPSLVKIK